jgi:hypothetical protein
MGLSEPPALAGGLSFGGPAYLFARRIARHLDHAITPAQSREFFSLTLKNLLVIVGWVTPATDKAVKPNLFPSGINQFVFPAACMKLL